MMKRVLPILLILLLMLPGAAMAHSRLEQSIPAQNAVLDASPETIELAFDTRIEKISNLKLFDASGNQIETERAQVDNDTMTSIVPKTLDNGVYSVKWTIIGADGHTIDGEYSFTVDAPAAEETSAPDESATPSEDPDASQSDGDAAAGNGQNGDQENPQATTEAPAAENGTDSAATEQSNKDFNVWLYVAIGAAIGAVIVILMKKRKS